MSRLKLSLLVTLLLGAALAACVSPRGQPPTATPTASAATTAGPDAAITATAPITITYWEEDSDAADVLLDQLAAAFMQLNPQIKVQRVHYSYNDLRDEFRAAAFRGEPPDLVRAPGEFAGPFGELAIVQPLDELFAVEYLEQFLSGALDGATVQRKVWGLPDNFGGHLMLLYNKALVSTAPADTDAWIVQLKSLTDAANGQYGLAYPVDESYWLIPWLAGFGSWPMDAQDHVILDTAEMVEALWFVHDLRFTHRVMPENVSYDVAFELFRTGKAAYVIDGIWNLDRYQGLGLDVGLAALPRVSQTGLLPAPMATGRYWYIAQDIADARLDAAARFVEYMTSAAAQQQWLLQMRRMPSLKELARSELITGDPTLAGSMAQLRVARGVPPALEMACAWQGLGAYLPDVMREKLSPDDAPPQMQARADACIEDMGGYLTPTP